MQSEHFDKWVKAAADQHHPAYDEQAWGKMEKLLDKHLPQKDSKRRFAFLLLFLFLLAGGGWLLIDQPWQGDKTVSATSKPAQGNNTTVPGAVINNNPSTSDIANEKSVNNQQAPSVVVTPTDPLYNIFNGTIKTNRVKTGVAVNSGNITSLSPAEKLIEQPGSDIKDDKQLTDQQVIVPGNPVATLPVNNDNQKKIEEAVKPAEKTTPEAVNAVAKNGKQAKQKNSFFFFSLSTGPDVSYAGAGLGKTKLLSGIGLGYTFNGRLTVKSGLYMARKLYDAEADDYYPSVPPPNMTYLQKIKADCKVYEIPLGISYNFSRSEKNSLFAGVGLSSYLMKKEDYDYMYKYPNGSTYTHKYTFENENKHFFSVLSLSAGYRRSISKRFSLSAEPYFKIPLSGVGHGKVHLNSAGVIFSVDIKPFR